ncbi:MAG: hypothetical protein DGJ47_000416 [Rickettsiaceae bacterium]
MNNDQINFEIKRKFFHLCAIFFPLLYIFTTKLNMCILLLTISSLTLLLDTYRHSNIKIKELVDNFFSFMMRNSEKSQANKLSGSSYMAMGLLLSCILFSKGLAINSWLILIVSDCFAAIIGMRFGNPLYNGKSIEGALAFFVSSVTISVFSCSIEPYGTNFGIMVFSCILTTLIEFFSKDLQINDNFSIPLTYGSSVVLLSLIF